MTDVPSSAVCVLRDLVPRERFVATLREACEHRSPFAAGKLGVSERSWLAYPIVLEREKDPVRRRAFELVLAHRSLKTSGIFPPRVDFLERWCARFVEEVAALDSIGILSSGDALELLDLHGMAGGRVTYFKSHQPERFSPSEPERCYLPALAGLDVLLLCPFADFLAERANEATFERVWAKTGKEWFHPRSVQSLELPYGFASATQRRYETLLDLHADIARELGERTYDVALIAAGGLGIPLANAARREGRIGISLGGHLQVLFGVLGERWRGRPDWRERYFNDAWVDLPPAYVPAAGESTENYW